MYISSRLVFKTANESERTACNKNSNSNSSSSIETSSLKPVWFAMNCIKFEWCVPMCIQSVRVRGRGNSLNWIAHPTNPWVVLNQLLLYSLSFKLWFFLRSHKKMQTKKIKFETTLNTFNHHSICYAPSEQKNNVVIEIVIAKKDGEKTDAHISI